MNGVKEYTYDEFHANHSNQLIQSSVPQLYWETLFKKLRDEDFDAGDFFMVQCIEKEQNENEEETQVESSNQTWKVVVKSEDGIELDDSKHIYLIDHAWSYRVHEARSYLEQVDGLTDRMAALMDIKTEGRTQKSIQDDILKHMWKYNQVYSIRNFTLGSNESLPVWYIMDEFGTRIQHSDEPTFKTAPFVYGVTGLAFTLLWPEKELLEGDEVTRDYVQGETNLEMRESKLLPWTNSDFTDKPYILEEPDVSFFTAHRTQETEFGHLTEDGGKLKPGRRLKVCIDYPDCPSLTDDRFVNVDTGEEADILWTNRNFKDFSSLQTETGCKYINQFPCESCLTLKDLLGVVGRRAATHCHIQPDLEGSPKWLPVTYNLQTELSQFISYFQHRKAKGLDNVWILKPWNLSNSADTTISDNLNQIIRARDSGPKVACKYVSDCVTLYREDIDADVKMDLRVLAFLASIDPLRLYAYRPVSIRRGHKAYELTDFDDLRRHLTYIGLYNYDSYRPGMYTEEFVPKFEKEYKVPWSTVEASIHEMLVELFKAAGSKPPPAGLGNCAASRAIYGIDIVFRKTTNNQGEKVIQPMICEVNFSPVYETWKENYPEMLNDAFSALFFDDISGREDRIVRLAP